MKSIGPIGRKTTGIKAVVFKAALMFIAGLVCCAAASAGEPERLRTTNLPQIRLNTMRLAPGAGSIETNGFRPSRLQLDRSGRAPIRFYDTHLMPELTERFRGMGSV